MRQYNPHLHITLAAIYVKSMPDIRRLEVELHSDLSLVRVIAAMSHSRMEASPDTSRRPECCHRSLERTGSNSAD
jgi:hypothetical protein